MFDRPYFKEFALRCAGGSRPIVEKARAAGFDIGPDVSHLTQGEGELVAVTEKRTRQEIDALAACLA